MAFVATMGWAPNVDAAVWLGREIWPEVLTRVPEARLLLVGKDPAPAVRALADEHIEVTGTVADVSPFLARSRVVVAPLRAGGGTRLKIMEALDVGRPVVATSVGCEGMEDLVGRGVVVADTAPALAEAIADLLRDPAGAAALGRAGHDAVAADHTWDTALAPLMEAVSSVLLVLAGIAGLGLAAAVVALFVHWERTGKEQLVPLVLIGMLVVEATLYNDPNSIPRGLFHPGSGTTQLRLPEIYITLALVARLIARGRPTRIGLPAGLWLAFGAWLAVGAVEGTLYHNSLSQDLYEAKGILYIVGAYALAAGVPIRKYIDSGALLQLGTLCIVCASVLDLMTLAGVSVNTNLPLLPLSSFGVVGAETAALYLAIVAMCFMVRLASGPVRLRHVLALIPIVGCVLLADQRAVLVNFGIVVLVVVVGVIVGPRHGIARRFYVTGGQVVLTVLALVAVAIVFVVVPAAVDRRAPQVPLASSAQKLFHDEAKVESAQDRLDLASAAEKLIPQHPIIGWGLGIEFQYYETGTRTVDTIAYAHNIVLDIWLRLGLIGLALFALALGDSIKGGLRVWWRHTGPGDGLAGAGDRRGGGRALRDGRPRAPPRRIPVRHALRCQPRGAACLRDVHAGTASSAEWTPAGHPVEVRGGSREVSAAPGQPRPAQRDRHDRPHPGPPPRLHGAGAQVVRSRPGSRAGSRRPRPPCRRCGAVAHSDRRGVGSRGAGMNLRQVVRTVRAHWVVALVTFLACLLIGAAYAVVPAKQYEATVVLLAQPPAGPNAGQDVAAIQIEIPQIAVEAENASVDAEIRTQVPEHLRSVPVTITATGDPASNTVTINATSTDPAAAQAYANATAARVLRVTNRDAGSLLVLSELGVAELPTTPSNPRATVAVAAFAFGLIAAVFAALAGPGVPALRRCRRDLGPAGYSGAGRGARARPSQRGSGRHVPVGRRRTRARGIPATAQPPPRHVPREPPGDRLHVL